MCIRDSLISHLVYQTAEFTPEKYDGTVTMDFHFNANDVIDRLGDVYKRQNSNSWALPWSG